MKKLAAFLLILSNIFAADSMIAGTAYASNAWFIWDFKKIDFAYRYTAAEKPFPRSLFLKTPSFSAFTGADTDIWAVNFFGFLNKGLAVEPAIRSDLNEFAKQKVSQGIYTRQSDSEDWLVPFEIQGFILEDDGLFKGKTAFSYMKSPLFKIQVLNLSNESSETISYIEFAKKYLVKKDGFGSYLDKYFNIKIASWLKYFQAVQKKCEAVQAAKSGFIIRVEVDGGQVFFPDIAPKDKEVPVINLSGDRNVFSPADPKGALRLTLTLEDKSEIGSWSIKIYRDVSSAAAEKLAEQEPFKAYYGSGKTADILWNGMSDTNALVPKSTAAESSTVYAFVVTAADAYGNTKVIKKQWTSDILVEDTPTGKKIVLSAIQFDSGKSEIQPKFIPVVSTLAAALKKFPGYKIRIEGHTDTTGDSAINEKISKARAQSVLTALSKQGISVSSMSSEGIGPQRPSADEKPFAAAVSDLEAKAAKEKSKDEKELLTLKITQAKAALDEVRSRNRRVEFYLVK